MIHRSFSWFVSRPLSLQTIFAMALGIIVGLAFGHHTAQFGAVAKALIAMIRAFATPLLFFAILDAWTHSQFKVKGIPWLFAVCAINGGIALAIALGINHLFAPGKYLVLPKELPPPTGAFASVKNTNTNMVEGFFANAPDNLVSPFLNQSIPGVILLAIVIGIGINRVKRTAPGHAPLFDSAVGALYELSLRAIEVVVKLSPIAVFAAVAQSVGTTGFAAAKGLAIYLVVMIGGMLIQIALTYQAWIAFFSRVRLRAFWREAKEPALYAAGVNSSLATLPLTLRALDRLGVSPASARLAACVGTNLNNDGILLYEAAAVLFVAQAYGVSLTFGQQIAACVLCAIATFGVAGVPEAGVIGLALVLNNVGISTEILPLFLTVDWVVARMRSVTNVVSDLTVACALDGADADRVEAS